MPEPARLFLSYMREDSGLVRDLAARLRKKGHDAWVDQSGLLPGEPWSHAVETAIRQAAHFLPCISPAFEKRESSYIRKEIAIAGQEAASRLYVQYYVIPVLLRRRSIPDLYLAEGVKIADLNAVDFEADRARAVEHIDKTVAAARQPNVLAAEQSSKLKFYIGDMRLEYAYQGYTYRWDVTLASDAALEVTRKKSDSIFNPREKLISAKTRAFRQPTGGEAARFETARGSILFIFKRRSADADPFLVRYNDPIRGREFQDVAFSYMDTTGSSAGAG